MDIKAIREFVNDHPEGVRIRMVNGVEYVIPHRDFIWFMANDHFPPSRLGRFATSSYVSHEGGARLANAPLVSEISPLGNSRSRRSSSKSKPRKR